MQLIRYFGHGSGEVCFYNGEVYDTAEQWFVYQLIS